MQEYDLEEIKREIVEGRSLTIKTNNLVNALSADLKSIAKRQQGYERRMFVHSVTAYIVAVVLVLGLSKLALDAQVEAVRAEAKADRDKLTLVETEFKTLQKRGEGQSDLTREATELYRLVREGDRAKYLSEYAKKKNLNFPPVERAVFDDAETRSRRELALLGYQTGIEHARAGRYHEATVALRQSIELEPDSPFSGQLTFELARAYRALDQQRVAIPLLISLTEASATADILDEATLLLAECQIDVQLFTDAKTTLRSFLRRFDKSPLKNDAKQLLNELDLKH